MTMHLMAQDGRQNVRLKNLTLVIMSQIAAHVTDIKTEHLAVSLSFLTVTKNISVITKVIFGLL